MFPFSLCGIVEKYLCPFLHFSPVPFSFGLHCSSYGPVAFGLIGLPRPKNVISITTKHVPRGTKGLTCRTNML